LVGKRDPTFGIEFVTKEKKKKKNLASVLRRRRREKKRKRIKRKGERGFALTFLQ